MVDADIKTESILLEAEQLVSGDRNAAYGPAWEDYTRTARLWSTILGTDVDPAKAALCMLAMKISRECYKHGRDNLVDIAGYAKVVQLIEEHRKAGDSRSSKKQMSLVYLASPYSDPDKSVREKRFRQAALLAIDLTRRGFAVYSPILASHALTELGLPQAWSFWQPVDERFLSVCDQLFVAKIEGFQNSIGVSAEVTYARERGIPVNYIDPPDITDDRKDWSGT